jgi:TPR repeat protein
MTIRLLLVIIFAGVLFTCRPQYLFAEEQTQSTYQAETSVSRLHANISKLAPNWMTTNDDPKFIEWAKSTREYKSGTAIIVLLNEAYERGDAGSVAAIFNDYDLKKQGSNSIELQQSALNKSQAAMYLYEKGDKKAALHDMEIAAGMGESLAQIWVAQAYFNGDGCEVNYEKAFKWYNEAAKQGDFFAQFNLGVFYNNGYFVKKDCKQAFYWYSKSALGSLPQAQYALGKMYDLGQCVDKNIKKAYEYWKMAADKGHTESQYSIATLYENGEYLQKDNVKALEWFLKAADSDHDKASLSAAVFYQTGKA